MRLHRFFIEERIEDKKRITVFEKELVHQWKNVFRLKEGNEVILLDNSGFEYFAVITSLKKDEAELEIVNVEKNTDIPLIKIHLFLALIKKERFEWALEKGTEIGISSFTPIITDRIKSKNINLGLERGKKIMKEAAEQSGRGLLPNFSLTLELEKVLSENGSNFIAFDPSGEKFTKEKIKVPGEVGVLIGPEGGWSEKELELFREKNIPIYKLGGQILRAETAAMTVSAILLLNN
jgi:16S rRNA (uracil1498-N3)-methyltransferase